MNEKEENKDFPEAIILDVDLTNKKATTRTLSSDIYKLYPGGTALGAYLMLQEMKPGVDPFSPDNLQSPAFQPDD